MPAARRVCRPRLRFVSVKEAHLQLLMLRLSVQLYLLSQSMTEYRKVVPYFSVRRFNPALCSPTPPLPPPPSPPPDFAFFLYISSGNNSPMGKTVGGQRYCHVATMGKTGSACRRRASCRCALSSPLFPEPATSVTLWSFAAAVLTEFSIFLQS